MGGRGASLGMGGGGIGGLTMADGSVTAGYTNTTSAHRINSALRKGQDVSQYQDVIDRLDSNMQPTTKKMTVFREVNPWDMVDSILKINPPENTFESLRNTAIGTEFTDKGFMSTYHTDVGNRYGSAIMKITAKPGTKAILTNNVNEAEVILGRNQRWKVTDVTMEDGDFVYHITNA